MKIIRLDVKETESGWHLKDARFDDINLLVGVSGVGKTKIVEAIRRLATMAFKSIVELTPMVWSIEYVNDNHTYCWEGEIDIANSENTEFFAEDGVTFKNERLSCDGNVIISRDRERLFFAGNKAPKFDASQSALVLLTGEADVKAARSAFMFLAFESGNSLPIEGYRFPKLRKKEEALNTIVQQGRTLFERIPKSEASKVTGMLQFLTTWATSLSSEKNTKPFAAYLAKQLEPERFARIKEDFCDIFPSVTDVTVEFASELVDGGDRLLLQFAIKESGSDEWILQPKMSSGMLRTLLHLVAIDAAPPGSVVVVDEFENSLGKNCLPRMTETLLEHVGEIQFILTSHHPYVINKIPIDCWQLVRRRGNTVTLTSARDIPALMDESHHDAFDRLLNIDEFIDGVKPLNEETT